jgi:hypothetical protein
LKPDALIAESGRRTGTRTPSFVLDVSVEVPAGITILFEPSGAEVHVLDCVAGVVRLKKEECAGREGLFDARVDAAATAQDGLLVSIGGAFRT